MSFWGIFNLRPKLYCDSPCREASALQVDRYVLICTRFVWISGSRLPWSLQQCDLAKKLDRIPHFLVPLVRPHNRAVPSLWCAMHLENAFLSTLDILDSDPSSRSLFSLMTFWIEEKSSLAVLARSSRLGPYLRYEIRVSNPFAGIEQARIPIILLVIGSTTSGMLTGKHFDLSNDSISSNCRSSSFVGDRANVLRSPACLILACSTKNKNLRTTVFGLTPKFLAILLCDTPDTRTLRIGSLSFRRFCPKHAE